MIVYSVITYQCLNVLILYVIIVFNTVSTYFGRSIVKLILMTVVYTYFSVIIFERQLNINTCLWFMILVDM